MMIDPRDATERRESSASAATSPDETAPDEAALDSSAFENEEPTFRLAPPEGVRAARGQNFDAELPADDAPDDLPDDVDIERLFSTEAHDWNGVQPNGQSSEPLGLNASSNSEAHEVWPDEPYDPFSEQQRADESVETVPVFSSTSQVTNSNGAHGATLGAPPTAPPPPTALDTSPGAGEPSGESLETLRDREMGLIEHLAELRKRLLYCFLAVGLASVFTWSKSPELLSWFSVPIKKALLEAGGKNGIISTEPTAFFTLSLSFSLASALILTMPFVLFQVWRFIEPALTNNERRYGLVIVPFSTSLFFAGAGLAYVVSPLFFAFFLQFQPPEVTAQWDLLKSVMLMAKMLLAFGLLFQVPVVVIFLTKIGLLTRDMLIQYWRHAIVAIFVVAAILTPTWDPVSLAACAVPPSLLYILSIWLVKWL